MSAMFRGCSSFNGDLSGWDVSNVKDMSLMFCDCTSFEGIGLENWDVSNVQFTSHIFHRRKALKKLPSWYRD
jgi:surface protein